MSKINKSNMLKNILNSENNKNKKRTIRIKGYTLNSAFNKDSIKNLVHRALPNLPFPEEELPKRKKSK